MSDNAAANDAATLYRVGAEEYKKGKYEQALAHFTQALERDPQFFRAYVYRGMALFEHGQVDQAIDDFKCAIRLDANYAKAHNGLGNAFRKKGHLVEAFQSYKKAVRIDPRQALYHHNLGITACDMGLYDIAVLELELAVLVDAESADLRYDLGAAYYLKADYAQAIRAFETFLDVAPDDERVPEVTAKIKGLRRKLEEQKAKPAEAKPKFRKTDKAAGGAGEKGEAKGEAKPGAKPDSKILPKPEGGSKPGAGA